MIACNPVGIRLFKVEAPGQCVKSIQSLQYQHQKEVIEVLVSLLIILNRFQTLFWCFYC